MKMKTLIDTNPYLKDADDRMRLIHRSVRTSCGVEGIKEREGRLHVVNIPSRGEKKIYKNLAK